ncbi:MAG: hypothetical protein HYR62_07645 [Actinobacteria bacterium]|nr:hypothetical protein [Actinomycetota bacterium]MBI3686555.1 hypothetical protein [Actinomycetota bacterium]
MTPRRAAGRVALITALAVPATTGCAADTPAAAQAGPPVATMRVGLVEWGFATSAGALRAGPVTLQVTNAGTTAHDLRVLAGDQVRGVTPALRPGQRTTLQVDLGGLSSVTFLCTLPGHREQGMRRELPVVADSSPTDSSPTGTTTVTTAEEVPLS